jgi:hypothetical protein
MHFLVAYHVSHGPQLSPNHGQAKTPSHVCQPLNHGSELSVEVIGCKPTNDR